MFSTSVPRISFRIRRLVPQTNLPNLREVFWSTRDCLEQRSGQLSCRQWHTHRSSTVTPRPTAFHLSAPWEPAGREAQLARVRQKQKTLARRPSGHEHTQCEGEGAVLRFPLPCRKTEDDGFHRRCERLSRPVVFTGESELNST